MECVCLCVCVCVCLCVCVCVCLFVSGRGGEKQVLYTLRQYTRTGQRNACADKRCWEGGTPYEGRLRLHCDSVNDSASLYAHLAGLLCHDPANTTAVN